MGSEASKNFKSLVLFVEVSFQCSFDEKERKKDKKKKKKKCLSYTQNILCPRGCMECNEEFTDCLFLLGTFFFFLIQKIKIN